jgi:glutamate synthase (ferredoxin)
MNFMRFVAQELREFMAAAGVRTVDELVGRSDLLQVRQKRITHRAETVDLSALLFNPYGEEVPHFAPEAVYNFRLEETKDCAVLLKKLGKSLKTTKKGSLALEVSSTDRAFGTLFGSEITRACGDSLREDSYVIRCHGGGGQSFGAFIPKGLTLRLEGDSNDGFGKGLSGGKLVLYPPKGSTFRADENIIVGNVALYGATSGEAYISGMAGERFCIRNSGAVCVVEGVGEHGCEYMTGGCVVILGKVGKNFAAGMSGGIAYVLDEENRMYRNLNRQMVLMESVDSKTEQGELYRMIQRHVQLTGSRKGQEILADYDAYIPHFKKIIPMDYKEILRLTAKSEEKGADAETARLEAFQMFAKMQE